MKTAAALAFLWALARPAGAQDNFTPKDAQACPAGTVRVATDSPYEPFHCVKQLDADTPFIPLTPLSQTRSCPRGSHAVDTPGLGDQHRYRCVMDRAADAEPQAGSVLSGAALLGASAPAGKAATSAFRTPRDYTRYDVHGQFELDAPAGWHVDDGWQDPEPTFYLELDTGRQGRQVSLVVSKSWKGQDDFLDLGDAVRREEQWQNAVELAPGRVAGLPARFTAIAKTARTAYVSTGDDSYYTISYTAPDDLFATFEPAYRRLLHSFRVSKTGL